MSTEDFEALIESICGNGCIEVNQTILLLEKGKSPSHLEHLDDDERHAILKELKSIMGVYDQQICSI